MSHSNVIRLEINGPAGEGLTKMDLDPEDFQSDLPEQNWHVYFEDETLGLTVGVWTTTTMQEKFGPYPGDEFMCILEGQVSIVDQDGKETPVKAGETFCIQNGIPASWKQNGFLRKFFITYAPKDDAPTKTSSSSTGVHILDEKSLVAKLNPLDSVFPFEIQGDHPVQKDSPVFVNDTGNMNVGMWESEPFESLMKPFPCTEFVQLLSGEINITEQSGSNHKFSAGDVFFIPEGTVCSWKTNGSVRKFYCMLLNPAEEGDV